MKKHILLLLLSLLLTVPAYADDTVDDYYDMARNFFESGDYDTSLEYIQNVLNISPNHFGANYLMIKLIPPIGFLDNEKNLEYKIVIRPKNTTSGNRQSDKLNSKGQDLYNQQRYNDALKAFEEAIDVNPDNVYAYNNLGLTHWKLTNYKKAEKAFKKANKVNKYFTVSLDNLAQMLMEHECYEQARKYIDSAVELNKNDYCARYLSGILSKKEGMYTDAIKSFNAAIQIAPNFALNYMQLADSYFMTKDYAWSNSSLEKYLELSPKDDFAYYMLYRNYLALQDYNVAKNYLIKAILINNCIDYRIALADVEGLLDNPKGAIDALRMIPEKTGELQNTIGQYYLKMKDYDRALVSFQQATLKPKARPIYFYNIAQVYKNTGDMENYEKMIKALESMHPMVTQDYVDLSGIFLDYAGKNKAIAILNKGIKLAPKNRELYEAKLRIYTMTSDKRGIELTQEQMNKVFK